MSPSVPPPGLPDPVASEPAPEPPAGGSRFKVLGSAVVVVAVVAVAIAVLGGSANKVVDPVAQAATVSASAPGYQLHMSMDIASSATSTPVTAVGDGTFDLRDHAGSLSLAMNLGNDPQVVQTLGSNTLKMQEIIRGTTVYVKIPGAASLLPTSGKQWIAVDLAKLTGIPGLSSLASNPATSNPSDLLQYLRAASNSIVAVGQQQVDGVAATHYRAELSLDRAVNAVPSAERAAAQQAISRIEQLAQIHSIPVDAWVDAHHLIRRFEMKFAASPASGATVSEHMTIDITHYGPEPLPVLPPASEVADLSSLLGG